MRKKIKWALLVLFAWIIAFVLFVFIEDLTYDKRETDTEMKEQKKALVLTWEADNQRDFWNSYRRDIHPIIEALHQKQQISQVFPFEHKPLRYQESAKRWTNCIVLMLSGEVYHSEFSSSLISSIEKSALREDFRSLDVMKIQRGLDMFYPVKNGIEREPKLNQTIEYLFSKPEVREQYYEDQYRFSGPAMQDLHHRDKAGRFIGFELEERIFASANVPQWDVIHIIGFTTWQEIKAAPFFYGTWNKHAERAFGEGMTFKKKVAEWNKIRTNVKSSTKQNFSMTLRR